MFFLLWCRGSVKLRTIHTGKDQMDPTGIGFEGCNPIPSCYCVACTVIVLLVLLLCCLYCYCVALLLRGLEL